MLDSGYLPEPGHRDPTGAHPAGSRSPATECAPQLSPSRVRQAIKGKTSHHLLQDHRKLRALFWGRHLWASGYFVCSNGNVVDETTAHYITHKMPRPRATATFESPEQVRRGAAATAVDFSRPVNPSPSGEGVSNQRTRRSAHSLRVRAVPLHGSPIVQVRILVDFGDLRDWLRQGSELGEGQP